MLRPLGLAVIALIATASPPRAARSQIVQIAVAQAPDFETLLPQVARTFYTTHDDDIDELVVWCDPGVHQPETFFHPIRNDIRGIGLRLFDDSARLGSRRLRGVVVMGNGWEQVASRGDDSPNAALGLLAQETMHAWGAYLKILGPDRTASDALLGREHAHWIDLLDTGGSVMGGGAWSSLGGERFAASRSVGVHYADLELYAMGALAPEDVRPTRWIQDGERCPGCAANVIEGHDAAVTIADIIAANGARYPAGEPPVHLRQAWILLVADGTRPASGIVATLKTLRERWPAVFTNAARGKAWIETSLAP